MVPDRPVTYGLGARSVPATSPVSASPLEFLWPSTWFCDVSPVGGSS
ncbi:hypothetical protein FHU33_0446 [Blastococcus colisei]|uniref:Uncharacterized protein n=1 Tax=Blastococcus colisei TaxID=1564162 RepID=A0A543PAI7_9ACTN|nr:hypothetical protein FHU33_0446 [Blastococcus colisei]